VAPHLHLQPASLQKRTMKPASGGVLLAGLSLATILSSSAAANEPLAARVRPVGCVAPCDILIQAFIEPHASNRVIEFIVDSGVFFTSSRLELNGERAPRAQEVRFRDVPSGEYEVRVTLIGTDGERGGVVKHVWLW
jgi:hypothetical protein